jgi:transposase
MPVTSVVGLDTAKNVFQVHGVDSKGNVTFRKRLRRGQLTDFFGNLPACVIGLEATQGAHWARVLETFGHRFRCEVRGRVVASVKSPCRSPRRIRSRDVNIQAR